MTGPAHRHQCSRAHDFATALGVPPAAPFVRFEWAAYRLGMDPTKHILVYSDSLTWGIVPGTRRRLPFDSRWPGVLHNALNVGDVRIRVTEDCLNGRRTAFDDPYKPGRNALAGIHQVVEAQSPLDVVILLLGTNDFQSMHPHSVWHSATGLAAVINAVRTAPIEPGMPVPPILLIAPPQLDDPRGPIGPKFAGGDVASRGLSDAIRQVSEDTGCAFFDANSVTTSSVVDGVHLDADQHEILGRALAPSLRN